MSASYMHNPSPLQQELVARDRGITLAAESRAHIVARAKYIAKAQALRHGETDADEVQSALQEEGFPVGAMGNAMGCVFKSPEWQAIGWRTSTRQGNHGRAIRIWGLR